MRHVLVLAVTALAAPALAGCLGTPDLPEASPAAGSASGFAMDCAVNARPEQWPDPCTARASWNEAPSKTEIDLAVNPKDPLNVIVGAKDLDPLASDCVWSVLYVTKDGGESWKTVYVGGDKANRHPTLAPYACVTDPIMAFDADGTAYYALQAYDSPAKPEGLPGVPFGPDTVGSTFVLARSTDGGESWDHYVPQHLGDGNLVFHDYPRMLVNPATQSVCVIWNGVGNAGVNPWVSCSRDGGESVEAPVSFWSDDSPRGTAFHSGFVAARDGTLFVTTAVRPTDSFFTGADETDVRIFRSTDDGRSFEEAAKAFTYKPTPRQLPHNEFRTPSFVEMAVDATEGAFADRLYVFYPDYSTGDSDVLSRYSTDGSLTWSEPVPVHADRANDQLMMRPAVGPDGTVHVLFYDRSRDPANRLLDAVHAWSEDGGATWRDQRLSSSGFDGDKGVHQDGFPFIGDYNGIAVAADGTVYAAWGDTRTGVAEVAFARVRAAE